MKFPTYWHLKNMRFLTITTTEKENEEGNIKSTGTGNREIMKKQQKQTVKIFR